MKDKINIIISLDEEKAFNKIQHSFLTKTLSKVSIKGTYLNIIDAVYNKLSANIILNGENPKLFL